MPARALLARVRRLERVRRPESPFVAACGSLEAWEDEMRAGIREGRFDSRDMPGVIAAVRRWHLDVWQA